MVPTECPWQGQEPGVQAYFGDNREPKDELLQETVNLIYGAADTATVYLASYLYNGTAAAEVNTAIADARSRGVTIEVVADDSDWDYSELQVLFGLANSDPGLSVTLCPGSCLGEQSVGSQHNKFILVSELCDGAKNVVAQSSANVNWGLRKRHNSTLVFRDDQSLYDGYKAYFELMKAEAANPNAYDPPGNPIHVIDPFYGNDGVKAYAFPRLDGGDTIQNILADTDCSGTPTPSIHVAMAYISNRGVLEALGKMAIEGCDVKIIALDDPTNAFAIQAELVPSGLEYRLFAGGEFHHKYWLMDATYPASSARAKIVWTGSLNFNISGQVSDDILIKIPSASLFNEFKANWDSMWTDSYVPLGGKCDVQSPSCEQGSSCQSFEGTTGYCVSMFDGWGSCNMAPKNFSCTAGEGDCQSDASCESGLSCIQFQESNGEPTNIDYCLPPGHGAFCSTASPCSFGEGDCDQDSECESGLVCAETGNVDVCLPSNLGSYCSGNCTAGEGDCDSDTDCAPGLGLHCEKPDGGTDYCLRYVNMNYCTIASPCGVGEGSCSVDSQCELGLFCVKFSGGIHTGANYCLPPGHNDFCTPDSPCWEGQGDCDTNSDCFSGLTCTTVLGAAIQTCEAL